MDRLVLLPDRVLVTLRNSAPTTSGGIIIPETSRERQLSRILADVHAVGILAARWHELAPGDVIIVEGRDSRTIIGTPILFDDVDYVIVRMDRIFAKLGESTNEN